VASAPPATAPASFYERTAVMLPALGLPPAKAAVKVLLAITAPVAFGAMAIPVTTAGNLTGIPPEDIASVIGRQSPLLAISYRCCCSSWTARAASVSCGRSRWSPVASSP